MLEVEVVALRGGGIWPEGGLISSCVVLDTVGLSWWRCCCCSSKLTDDMVHLFVSVGVSLERKQLEAIGRLLVVR